MKSRQNSTYTYLPAYLSRRQFKDFATCSGCSASTLDVTNVLEFLQKGMDLGLTLSTP